MTSFNLRRDHRSLATVPGDSSELALSKFQSQARPPLPCHRGTIGLQHHCRRVSISGETTAPLPPNVTPTLAGISWYGFNLRRDHRSLATMRGSQHALRSHRFQSQARPPLPCHPDFTEAEALLLCVSISGETTAPLPLI